MIRCMLCLFKKCILRTRVYEKLKKESALLLVLAGFALIVPSVSPEYYHTPWFNP